MLFKLRIMYLSPLIRSVLFYTGTSSQKVTTFLTLDKSPVAGEPIRFTVKVINKQRVPKKLIVHLNAQAKEYNHGPSDTFWENHGVMQLAPMEGKFTSRLDCRVMLYQDLVMNSAHLFLFLLSFQSKCCSSRSIHPSTRMFWEIIWSTWPLFWRTPPLVSGFLLQRSSTSPAQSSS